MNLKELLGDKYVDGMSFEDVELALAGIEMPVIEKDSSAELERLRNALTKSNSEAASYKKQLREQMSEEEVRKAEQAEARQELERKYEELLQKVQLSEYKSKFLAIGYDETLAAESAEAMVNNDIEKLFANQQKNISSVETRVKEALIKGIRKPEEINSKANGITKEDLQKMSLSDRHKFYTENPEAYKEIYNGGN